MGFYLSLGASQDGKESASNAGDLSSISDQEDPLEKGMATHSSILAWRILWTEETGRGRRELNTTEPLILSLITQF